jgi:hypothetical protein
MILHNQARYIFLQIYTWWYFIYDKILQNMSYKNKTQKADRRYTKHDFSLSHEDRITYNYARKFSNNEIVGL